MQYMFLYHQRRTETMTALIASILQNSGSISWVRTGIENNLININPSTNLTWCSKIEEFQRIDDGCGFIYIKTWTKEDFVGT